MSTSVVQFAGSNRTTTFVNSTQLTASISATDLTTAGTFNITVFNPAGGGTSNAQTFTVINPLPTTTSISPTNKIVGATFTLTVNGTNFVSTSVVQFAGSNRTTSFVNSTQVTATILASDLTTAGTFNITVFNPTPGGGTSNAQVLTVNNPVPTTTSISPTNKIVGAAAFTLTVNGTDFVSTSVVQFAGSARTTTVVNSTQLTVSIPATDLTTAGTFNITVFSPTPGGGMSNAQTFTVVSPPAAPSTPVLLPTTAGNPEDNVTASITPSFYGTTGSTATTVTIYSDGVAVGSGTAANYANNTIGVSGSTPLSIGAHSITAVAADQFGNTSPASGALSIEVVRDIPAPTVIGTANTNNTAANALTQTTGMAVALGNTVFVTVGMDAGTQTVTVSDNATGGSNTYTKDAEVTNGSGTTGVRTLVFSAPVIHALTSSNTITITAGGAVNMAATYFYSTGLVSPSPKDKLSTNGGNSTTPASGTTAVTSQADELLLGAVTYERQQGQLDVSTGNSFVNLAKSSPGGQAPNQFQLESAYQPVRAAGAYQASWTYNNGQNSTAQLWAAAIVTYKIVYPTISSIVMAPASITTQPSTTNLNDVTFTVTFSERVLGIDAEDFALDSTNTAVSGAYITGVTTTDNTVYAVAVNTGTGNGTIQLNYHDDADVTVNGNNIPLNGSAAVTPLTIPGPTYTVSKSVATSLALGAPNPASVSFGSTGAVTFSATLSRTTGGAAVSGATVNFTVDGNAAGSATTDGSGVATFSTYNPSALSVAGHNVQASFAGATISGSTYTASTSGTQALTVTTADQTITFGTLADKTYGDPSFTVSATGGASGNPVTFTAGPIGVCTAGGSTITITGAGTCTVTAHQVGNSNYNAAADVPQSFTVKQGTPTVSFTGAPATAYFNSHFTVSATTNASTTPTITASGACTILGTTATIISGTGTCSLLASWAADTNYFAATATQSTSALQVPVSVTVPDTTVTYDGAPKAVIPTVAPAVAYAVTYTGISPTVYTTSSTAPTEPGSYSVVATVTDPNYVGSGSGTLTVIQKDPALVLTLLTGMPEPSTYGTRVYFELTTANSPCPTGQVQFFVDSDSQPSATVALTSTTCTKPVEFSTATLMPGTHSVYAVYGGANSIDGSATVPSGKVQFYDGTTLLGESPLSSTTATFIVWSLPAGSHSMTAIFVSANGDFSGNSSPVNVETVDKITPTITWPNPADIVYGTTLSTTQLNATATDTHNGGITVNGTFTYNPAVDTVLAVGSRNLTVTFAPDDTATYGNQTATATINVRAATLTVTADDASRYYGANNPTFTSQYSGFVNSEGSGIVTTAPTCTSTADSKSNIGTYAITCSGGAATNYTIEYVDGKLTVNPATLTITANDAMKTYGETVTFAGTEFMTSGLANGDSVSNVTLTSAGAAATATVAGSPYAITPSSAVGTGLTNYTITYKDGKLTVNTRNATWTTNPNSKTYGYADPSPLTTGSGNFLEADGVTATYSRAAGEAVLGGPYHITATLAPAAVLTNYAITNTGTARPTATRSRWG